MAATYTTREAARKIGVDPLTLQRWISSGKVAAPPLRNIKGFVIRLWSERDIKRLLRFKATQRRGRPPKRKRK